MNLHNQLTIFHIPTNDTKRFADGVTGCRQRCSTGSGIAAVASVTYPCSSPHFLLSLSLTCLHFPRIRLHDGYAHECRPRSWRELWWGADDAVVIIIIISRTRKRWCEYICTYIGKKVSRAGLWGETRESVWISGTEVEPLDSLSFEGNRDGRHQTSDVSIWVKKPHCYSSGLSFMPSLISIEVQRRASWPDTSEAGTGWCTARDRRALQRSLDPAQNTGY